MWQFAESIRGLAEGCKELGVPVTGGNVSFYNQTGATPILPTPVIAVLGVIDDVRRRIPTGFGAEPGETLLLLGDTREEFGGSEWAHVAHGHLGGFPPSVDLGHERVLADVMAAGSRDGMISAAHDLSEGGLIQAVIESALIGQTGCRIVLPDGADPFVWLFSESTGRVLVVVPRTEEQRFTDMCTVRGMPYTRIGVVDGESRSVEVQDLLKLPLDELRTAWESTLPGLFD
jgi:phosphoribosylformylglycinamidine synthase